MAVPFTMQLTLHILLLLLLLLLLPGSLVTKIQGIAG